MNNTAQSLPKRHSTFQRNAFHFGCYLAWKEDEDVARVAKLNDLLHLVGCRHGVLIRSVLVSAYARIT